MKKLLKKIITFDKGDVGNNFGARVVFEKKLDYNLLIKFNYTL